MHDCEEFRERITEHIIDQEDLAEHADIQRELLRCRNCSDFCAESREMIEALSSVDFPLSEGEWSAMTHRLRLRIVNERPEQDAAHQRMPWSFRAYMPAAAEVLPVVNVMETYETILRDLRNLDEHTAAEDISGIQNRIKKSALIANMKTFQPNLSLVSFGR